MREAVDAAPLPLLILRGMNIGGSIKAYHPRPERLPTRLSEVADGVAEPDAAADLGREVFDEREVVAVEAVAEVEGVDREDLRVVRARDGVGGRQVEEGVAGRPRLGREEALLVFDEGRLRLHVESLVAPVQTDARAHRRDTRQRR